jgi:hypothetical protein
MLFDVYVHRDDLERTMKIMRSLLPVTDVMWLHTYVGYVRALTITVTGSEVGVKDSNTVSTMLKTNTNVSQKARQENVLYSTK